MKIALCTLALIAAAGTANAAIFNEVEGNNTMATANPLGTYGSGEGILIDGVLTGGTAQGQTGAPGTAGDVDWFSFTVTGNAQMVASIFALVNSNPGATSPDSQLVVTDAAGNILAYNDDDNVGLMSSIDTLTLNPGTYFIGVTGFNDMAGGTVLPDGFEGTSQVSGHGENWSYKLIIGLNVVPTPSAAALMGLGALVAGRRRR